MDSVHPTPAAPAEPPTQASGPDPNRRGRRRLPRWRGTLATGTVVALVAAVLTVVVSGSSASAAVGTRSDNGSAVTKETVVNLGTLDLEIDSKALRAKAMVRLLLPATWYTQPTRTYPQLWLLHGANPEVPDYTSWTAFTDVASFMAGRDVLTVLPSDGPDGFYSAEWNYGLWKSKDYETFHTVELPQILARGYRANTVRAVGGISIGGLGAMYYVAEHPGMFRAAAAYSGMLDTLHTPGVATFVDVIRGRSGHTSTKLWGNRFLGPNVWADHNPYDLLPQLRGTPLFVSCGDGTRGPLDPPTQPLEGIESTARLAAQSFLGRAAALGVPVTTHLYRGGLHRWPYWQREFKTSWPMLASALGVPV